MLAPGGQVIAALVLRHGHVEVFGPVACPPGAASAARRTSAMGEAASFGCGSGGCRCARAPHRMVPRHSPRVPAPPRPRRLERRPAARLPRPRRTGPRMGPAADPTRAPHRQHRRREEPPVYVWEYLTRTSHHNGGMRSISATFRMTQPTDAQAMEWMTATMRHALRWGSSRPAWPDDRHTRRNRHGGTLRVQHRPATEPRCNPDLPNIIRRAYSTGPRDLRGPGSGHGARRRSEAVSGRFVSLWMDLLSPDGVAAGRNLPVRGW